MSVFSDVSMPAYLVAGICFILALSGLSHPVSARRGNWLGVIGMVIAIVTTLLTPAVQSYLFIVVAIAVGGLIGTILARKVSLTALPQLVAAFQFLIGMAAVLVATAALLTPQAYGIGMLGHIHSGSLVAMSLGAAIGAIAFSGSVVAFGKVQGVITGRPLMFKFQHLFNAVLGIALVLLLVAFALTESHPVFYALLGVSFMLGFLLILPIAAADMPVVMSMLNSCSGWAASGIGFTVHNPLLIMTGALVGSSGAILSYRICKDMNRSMLSVILAGGEGQASGDDRHSGQGD